MPSYERNFKNKYVKSICQLFIYRAAMLHIYAWNLVLVEGNVTVNKLVQTIVQHPAFRETINSVLTATNQEQSCLLLRLKSRNARGASHHPAFMGNCLTINHTC